MLTDRQRKLETIIFNVFHMKYRPVSMEELTTYTLLEEQEIRASFEQYKGHVIEVKRNHFILSSHQVAYENQKRFGRS